MLCNQHCRVSKVKLAAQANLGPRCSFQCICLQHQTHVRGQEKQWPLCSACNFQSQSKLLFIYFVFFTEQCPAQHIQLDKYSEIFFYSPSSIQFSPKTGVSAKLFYGRFYRYKIKHFFVFLTLHVLNLTTNNVFD